MGESILYLWVEKIREFLVDKSERSETGEVWKIKFMPEGDTQAKSNDFELYLIVSSLQRNLLYHIANSGLFIGQIFARFISLTIGSDKVLLSYDTCLWVLSAEKADSQSK